MASPGCGVSGSRSVRATSRRSAWDQKRGRHRAVASPAPTTVTGLEARRRRLLAPGLKNSPSGHFLFLSPLAGLLRGWAPDPGGDPQSHDAIASSVSSLCPLVQLRAGRALYGSSGLARTRRHCANTDHVGVGAPHVLFAGVSGDRLGGSNEGTCPEPVVPSEGTCPELSLWMSWAYHRPRRAPDDPEAGGVPWAGQREPGRRWARVSCWRWLCRNGHWSL